MEKDNRKKEELLLPSFLNFADSFFQTIATAMPKPFLYPDCAMTQTANTPPPQTFIKLDQFLKWQGITQTGGEAKLIVQEGAVSVNGIIETRRGRKLISGDRVTIAQTTYEVQLQ